MREIEMSTINNRERAVPIDVLYVQSALESQRKKVLGVGDLG
jgi:hypothetical protein